MPRRATLRSHLGGRAPGGSGEAGRNAPRWSHVSASAVRTLFDSWPQGQIFRKLVELAVSPRAWDRMERELSPLLPDAHHLSTALSVLRYHCDRLETLSTPNEQRCACKSLTRTLNKKARALQRVTEAPAAAAVPPVTTVSDWRSADPSDDRRRESSRCPATQSAVRAWQVSHLAGALAPQRARRRMAVECSRVRGRSPAEFAPRLVNNESLPTLTTNAYDHWMWPNGEYLSVEEASRACGVPDGNPLHTALAHLTPIQAVSALGDGVHVSVAEHIVTRALVGLAPRGPGSPVSYGSSFSGIDGFAAAVHSVSGGHFTYAFAAERRGATRSALLAAWANHGLCEANALTDARLLGGAGMPHVHLFSCTPPCKPFSKGNEAWTHQARAEALADFHLAMNYVRNLKPDRVVIENVTSPCVVTGIGTILGMLTDYDFVRHELCPFLHFGIPTRRLRSYWIGSRRIVTLGEARVAGVG